MQACRQLRIRFRGRNLGFLQGAVLSLFLLCAGNGKVSAQDERHNLLMLFRLDGTFGTELPAKIDSTSKPEKHPFALINGRLEQDRLGFLTKLRSVLRIANTGTQRITRVQWRVDVYDEALHTLNQRVLQEAKLNIYAGETSNASANFGAVLPDKMIVLIQLFAVGFDDGTAWTSGVACSLKEDLRTVSCESR